MNYYLLYCYMITTSVKVKPFVPSIVRKIAEIEQKFQKLKFFLISQNQKSSNAQLVLQVLKQAQGVLPKKYDGVEYEDKVRHKVVNDWEKKIKQFDL